MPRPWWLTEKLSDTYVRYMTWNVAEEEKAQETIVQLKFLPTSEQTPDELNSDGVVVRHLRPPAGTRPTRFNEYALSAQGDSGEPNWTLSASFKGNSEFEEYEFKLQFEEPFEEGFVFESWDSVRNAIANAQGEIGLELSVSPGTDSEDRKRKYRIRFAKEVHDLEVYIDSSGKKFNGAKIVEPSRIDLDSSIVHLRRRS
jgi:hypothetical protein